MDKEKFQALCELYFLHTIQPKELEELKSALNSGDEKLREIFYKTRLIIHEDSKPIELFDKLNDRKFNDNELSEKRRSHHHPEYFLQLNNVKLKLMTAITILLFIALIIISIYFAELLKKNENINKFLVVQNSELQNQNDILNVLQSKRINIINLLGQDVDPESFGKIFWSPETKKAVLQVSDLPPIDKNNNYQLWLIKNNATLNEGTINNSELNSQGFIKINKLSIDEQDKNYSFIVTLEEKGNTIKPKGVIYLYGRINN